MRLANVFQNAVQNTFRRALLCGAYATLAASLASASVPEPKVSLRSEGSGDKAPLRLKYKAGDTVKATTQIETTIALSGEGLPKIETPLPLIELHFETTVESVSDSGVVVLVSRLADVDVSSRSGVPDEVVSAVKDDLETLEGLTVKVTQSDRGITSEANFDVPSRLSETAKGVVDEMRAMVVLSSTILPEEPVGDGASWEVTVATDNDGKKHENTLRYELLKRDGQALELEITSSSTGDAGPFTLPGLPEGARFEPKGSRSSGASKGTTRLDKPSGGSAGTSESVSEYRLELPDGSSKDFTVTYTNVEKTTDD